MKTKGFTLIELMIVIAIIGILAAIAMSAYEDRQRKKGTYTGPNVPSTTVERPAAANSPITEYTLSDGTLCVRDNGSGQITCNWKKQP